MKTLSYFIIPFFLYNCSLNIESKMEQKWNRLLKAKTEIEEIKNIKDIKKYISNTNGNFSIKGVKNKSIEINIQDTNIQKFEYFIIKVEWTDKTFKSEKWRPLNSSNIYIFYRE